MGTMYVRISAKIELTVFTQNLINLFPTLPLTQVLNRYNVNETVEFDRLNLKTTYDTNYPIHFCIINAQCVKKVGRYLSERTPKRAPRLA